MRNKKFLVALLALVLALALVACGKPADEPQISGTVSIVWADGTSRVWENVQVAEGATASQALTQVLQAEKMAFTHSNGMWDGFDGVMSTMEEGWLLYVDGEMVMVGADDVVLADGFKFSFEYVNYAVFFGW